MAAITTFQLMQLAFGCIFLFFLLLSFLVFARYFRVWIKALLSGAPVPLVQLIGMTLRRINMSVIVDNYILAKQSKLNISALDLERAYLRGVDIEKVTLAAIHADQRNKELTFEDLVNAEIEGRLAEKLEQR